MSQPVYENHDDEDVAAILARETADGFGVDPLPDEDFVSYATNEVVDNG